MLQSERSEQGAEWTDMIRCLVRFLEQDDPHADTVGVAAGQATDLVIVELVLCLLAQSASFMYR